MYILLHTLHTFYQFYLSVYFELLISVKLVPPSAPDVVQLSDTSVKLNWTVPSNDGLSITFFRIQYRAIKPKKTQWKTEDTDVRGDQRMYELIHLKQGEVEDERKHFDLRIHYLGFFFLFYLIVFKIIVPSLGHINYLGLSINRDGYVLSQ